MPTPTKKSEKKRAFADTAWRPDFRKPEQLPDVSVVRLAFFINGAAVLVAVILVLVISYRELLLSTDKASIREWERVITEGRAASDAAVAKFREFQAMEKQVSLAESLLKEPLVVSDLVRHLGETLPPGVRLTLIEYKGSTLRLNGIALGPPEQASGIVDKYRDQLKNDEVIQAHFSEVDLLRMSLESSTENIAMEFLLKAPAPKKTEAKK